MQGCWWAEESVTDAGKSLDAVVRRLDSKYRHSQQNDALKALSTYLGYPVGSLKQLETSSLWSSESDQWGLPQQDIPYSRTAVSTAVARIAAKQRPKPVVLTQGADYRTRLQARQRSKFLEGQFQEAQGQYATIYDLGLQVFWDSALYGGIVKVQPSVELEKVEVSRRFFWNFFFDEADARMGAPTQLYERCLVDRAELIERFPEHEATIMRAPHDPDTVYDPTDRRQIVVWDCYRKPFREGKPGRHLLLCGDVVLTKPDEEEWLHDGFPYAFLFWERSPVGVRSLTPIEVARRPQRCANYLLERCLENTVLLAGGYIDAEEGAQIPEALASNDSVKIMYRLPGRNPSQVIMPAPFNAAVLDLAERYKSQVFEIFGVSELAAQGRKEPGIDSGIALRNMTDLQDMRFLAQARSLEQWYVDVGKLMLQAVDDLRKAGIRPTSYLPSEGGFIEAIEWDAIEIGEKSLYTVQVRAGSDIADSYSARLQFVTELQANGTLDAATAQRMLLSGNPDLEGYSNRKQAQWTWIERLICDIHNATDKGAIDVPNPDELMDLPAAAMQMTEAYLECSSWPKTPENKRTAMRDWVVAAITLLKRAQPPAPPPTDAGLGGSGPVPPPTPPGLPPGPPNLGVN